MKRHMEWGAICIPGGRDHGKNGWKRTGSCQDAINKKRLEERIRRKEEPEANADPGPAFGIM